MRTCEFDRCRPCELYLASLESVFLAYKRVNSLLGGFDHAIFMPICEAVSSSDLAPCSKTFKLRG